MTDILFAAWRIGFGVRVALENAQTLDKIEALLANDYADSLPRITVLDDDIAEFLRDHHGPDAEAEFWVGVKGKCAGTPTTGEP